jgi:undecaprenyl-diphosphatase
VTIFEAIFLGIIQGATEFLPISSSGHLLLVPHLFNLSEPDLNAIAIAHQGTLLAIIVYFRQDLWAIIKAVIAGIQNRQPMATTDSRLGWYIVVGSIPAVIVGLFFAEAIDSILANPTMVAIMLVATGFILILGERLLTGLMQISQMSWSDSLLIGLTQAFALIPGISRSGVTITGGLWRGLDRPGAARFSFLLGVPAIAGAGLLAAIDLTRSPDLASLLPQLLASFVAAAIVGYLCILFLMNWLQQRKLYIFAAYCIIFGLLNLIVIWL